MLQAAFFIFLFQNRLRTFCVFFFIYKYIYIVYTNNTVTQAVEDFMIAFVTDTQCQRKLLALNLKYGMIRGGGYINPKFEQSTRGFE